MASRIAASSDVVMDDWQRSDVRMGIFELSLATHQFSIGTSERDQVLSAEPPTFLSLSVPSTDFRAPLSAEGQIETAVFGFTSSNHWRVTSRKL